MKKYSRPLSTNILRILTNNAHHSYHRWASMGILSATASCGIFGQQVCSRFLCTGIYTGANYCHPDTKSSSWIEYYVLAGSTERRIPYPTSNPMSQMFRFVSCPNYTYEVSHVFTRTCSLFPNPSVVETFYAHNGVVSDAENCFHILLSKSKSTFHHCRCTAPI